MTTMFEAQAMEFPFVERLPKREKSAMGKLWDRFQEASRISEKEGMLVPAGVAARLLDVSRQRVYDLCKQGTLRTVDLDGSMLITENSLVEYCQTERKAGRPIGIPTTNKEILQRAVQAGLDHYKEARARRKR